MKVTAETGPKPALQNTTLGGTPVEPVPGSEPDDPVDHAADSVAEVPLTPAASAAVTQFKFGAAIIGFNLTIVLDAPPTPGNILVAIETRRSTSVPTGPDGTGWTQHSDGIAVATPPNNGQMSMWWRPVVAGDTDTFNFGTGGASKSASIIELEGVTGLIDEGFLSDQNGTAISISATVGANETLILAAVLVKPSGNGTIAPDVNSTELIDEMVQSGTWPEQWVAYRIIAASNAGTYAVGGTESDSGRDWAGMVMAFEHESGATIFVPADEVVDGDDATYDESSLADGLHIDLGAPTVIGTVHYIIGHSTSGSKTYHIFGANEADFSDEVDLATDTFTATGSFTPDDESATITDTTAYRYWRFNGPVGDRRWFTVEMFPPDDVPADLSLYQLRSEKDQPDGYAGLDSGGLLDPAEIPPIDILTTTTSETDGSLVLHPDGAGGVEWGLDATGGGGSGGDDDSENQIVAMEVFL